MNLAKPYYAVIFTSTRTPDPDGYAEMARRMEDLAREQPGYLGFESARDELGISVSYWDSLDAIAGWKAHADHLMAQQAGRKSWYSWYKVRVCRVEREYEFSKKVAAAPAVKPMGGTLKKDITGPLKNCIKDE